MSTFGTKMRLAASEVRPGDFTSFDGRRLVFDCYPCSGRRVAIVRSDDSIVRVPRGEELIIHRRDIA